VLALGYLEFVTLVVVVASLVLYLRPDGHATVMAGLVGYDR
jgi:hypothetical protein